MKTMKIQFHPNIPTGSPGVAFDEERKAGEVAHPPAFARFGGGQTVGGTPTAADGKIPFALKKIGHRGTIKIKKGTMAGFRLGNSKSQQLPGRSIQKANEGAAILSSNGFPNNTQALAMGNLSNIQLLQKQQQIKTKQSKLVIIRQKKGSQSLSLGPRPASLPAKSELGLAPMQAIGKAEQQRGTQGKAEATLATHEAGLINLRIGGTEQSDPEAGRQSSLGLVNQPAFVEQPAGPHAYLGQRPSMLAPQSAQLAQTLKRVHFQQPEQKPTMEQLELNRRQNSQRQVLIRKHGEPQQRRRGRHRQNQQMQKCGTEFSYSVSTKTNLSAPTVPLGGHPSLKRKPSPPILTNLSPQNRQLANTKAQSFFKTIGATNTKTNMPLKVCKKNTLNYQSVEKNGGFNKTLTNGFRAQQRSHSVASLADGERPSSLKATLPLKSIKLPSMNKQMLKIKPPLHNKKLMAPPASVEDILKLADEGIASIDQELFQKEQPEHGKPNKQKISSNFNLSFNNSFNTSYANSQQKHQEVAQPPPNMLQFQSTLKKQKDSQDAKQHDYSGYITKDAIILEKQLADHLQNLNDDGADDAQSRKTMQALGQTFDEVIKRDKSFGSLLLKIKQAYDDYLRKQVDEPSARSAAPMNLLPPSSLPKTSPVTPARTEPDLEKLKSLQAQLDESQQRAAYQTKQIKELQENLANKEIENQELKDKLRKLAEKQTKDSGVQTIADADIQRAIAADQSMKSGSLQVRGDNAANMSLSLSNQSAADLHLPIGNKQVSKAQSLKGSTTNHENREQMLEDMSKLAQQNKQLNDACASMDDEIHYLKLREKKIMYLVHLLQNKGYPVQKIYEQELKQVPTMRIQEFLDEKEREHYEKEYGGPEIDDKYEFSFHTDDSFEPIADGPALKPPKPDCVPCLDLEGLPGYETSSDEAEEEEEGQDQASEYLSQQQPEHYTQPPFHYQESMKYIQDFYDKHQGQHGPATQNSEDEDDELQVPNQAGEPRNPTNDQREPVQYSESLAGDEVIEEDVHEQ